MNSRSLLDYLPNLPLFQHLSEAEKQQLAAAARYCTTHKHAYVYLPDETSDQAFILVKGIVKIGTYFPDGREIIKSVQHPFSLFGELGLTGEESRNEFACAMNADAHYFAIKVDDLKAILQSNFMFTQDIILYLGERLRKAERHWESLIIKDVRTRIVEFLKENAGERGRQVGYEMLVKHGLTQQDIANLVGASRQTVASILNSLRKSNLIYFNRDSILIRDMEKLN